MDLRFSSLSPILSFLCHSSLISVLGIELNYVVLVNKSSHTVEIDPQYEFRFLIFIEEYSHLLGKVFGIEHIGRVLVGASNQFARDSRVISFSLV